jgi:hypothetical protein
MCCLCRVVVCHTPSSPAPREVARGARSGAHCSAGGLLVGPCCGGRRCPIHTSLAVACSPHWGVAARAHCATCLAPKCLRSPQAPCCKPFWRAAVGMLLMRCVPSPPPPLPTCPCVAMHGSITSALPLPNGPRAPPTPYMSPTRPPPLPCDNQCCSAIRKRHLLAISWPGLAEVLQMTPTRYQRFDECGRSKASPNHVPWGALNPKPGTQPPQSHRVLCRGFTRHTRSGHWPTSCRCHARCCSLRRAPHRQWLRCHLLRCQCMPHYSGVVLINVCVFHLAEIRLPGVGPTLQHHAAATCKAALQCA